MFGWFRVATATFDGALDRALRKLFPGFFRWQQKRLARAAAAESRERQEDLTNLLRMTFRQPPREMTDGEKLALQRRGLSLPKINHNDPQARAWCGGPAHILLEKKRERRSRGPQNGWSDLGLSAKRDAVTPPEKKISKRAPSGVPIRFSGSASLLTMTPSGQKRNDGPIEIDVTAENSFEPADYAQSADEIDDIYLKLKDHISRGRILRDDEDEGNASPVPAA